MTQPQTKRRFRVSVRMMFVVMTAICVLLGVFLAVTPQVALAAILMTAHAGVAAIWGAILGAAIVSTRSLKLGLAIGGIELVL